MSEFTGKTVIITGAGKGIGRACVELLTHRGARVVALSRSQADLDDLAAMFGATVVSVDLADNAAARATMKKAGFTDSLINCAGTNVLESVLDMTERAMSRSWGSTWGPRSRVRRSSRGPAFQMAAAAVQS